MRKIEISDQMDNNKTAIWYCIEKTTRTTTLLCYSAWANGYAGSCNVILNAKKSSHTLIQIEKKERN